MKVDADFLKLVERRGWWMNYVGDDFANVSCPNPNCELRLTVRPEGHVPQACSREKNTGSVAIEVFDDARLLLRERRERMCLTIAEVEEMAGMSVDFLAKFEKDDIAKYPNAQTFIEWARALGYRVHLEPGPLPPLSIRYVAETRRHIVRRRSNIQYNQVTRTRRAANRAAD